MYHGLPQFEIIILDIWCLSKMTMLCYSEFLTPRSWKCFDSQAMEFNYNQSSTSMKYIFVQILPIYMVAPKKYLAPKSTYCNVSKQVAYLY